MQKTWFVTGASRGFGVEIAKAAVRSGDRVVATARKRTALVEGLGPDSGQLLSVELDVTDAAQARKAVDSAISRFGGIDVLVNNAGYGHMGFFEEMTIEDVQQQFATNLFGVFNVTWAALPSMRAARKGRIFNISSLGGILGVQFGSLYCGSKFALEGFSESLSKEISPFGLFVTIVEPGPFRTDFLRPESARFRGKPIADYDDRRAQVRAGFEERNGLQPGDPVKLAEAIVRLADEPNPPMRFLAGTVALNAAEEKLAGMRAEFEKWRKLSVNTDGDYTDSSLGAFCDNVRFIAGGRSWMIRKIEIERFSLITSKGFDEVLAAVKAAIGHPDMAEFWRSTQQTPSATELESTIEKAVGKTGLMLFVAFDHGAIISKTGPERSRIVRLVIGNPLIMKEMAKRMPDAGSYAPVTVLVDERTDGVHLSYDRMASLLAPYENPEALEVARNLDMKVEDLLRRAAA